MIGVDVAMMPQYDARRNTFYHLSSPKEPGMRQGIFRDLPNADYHGSPGDSKSTLDIVRKSPVNLHALRKGITERKKTAAQELGTALHCLVLEPQSFAHEYALPFVAPEGALNTIDDLKTALTEAGIAFKQATKKDGLIALVREHIPGAVILADAEAAHADANEGKTILDVEMWDQLHRMRDAVMAHHAASKLLSAPGESELSCFWMEPVICPITGEHLRDENGDPANLPMRCRPDFWRYDGILVDLKTTSPENASVEDFPRSVFDWRYYVQHPLYLRGTRAALKIERAKGEGNAFHQFATPRKFVFIAVENDACVVDGVAKGVAVYSLTDESVVLGIDEMTEDMARLWECYQSGKWPGYSQRVESLSLPAYAFTRAAQRKGLMQGAQA
jgi:exodeoxyribonuclease VIII